MKRSFFERPVLSVARELIGCGVVHDGAAGVIVETEAYHDSEPACHAFVGLTPRTRTLFGPPGIAYVYRSYGIHALLNAVCEPEGVGAAVLIRALEPVDGIDLMRARRGVERVESLCSGPGKLTQALGIELEHNGVDLLDGPISIFGRRGPWRDVDVSVDRRIGITKAAELPWRFSVTGSRFVSRRVTSPVGKRGVSAAAERGVSAAAERGVSAAAERGVSAAAERGVSAAADAGAARASAAADAGAARA